MLVLLFRLSFAQECQVVNACLFLGDVALEELVNVYLEHSFPVLPECC